MINQTVQPDNYLFKDSAYDFDDVLFKAGYEISRDMEHQVVFEKNIFPQKEFDPNVIGSRDLNFKINVIRPKHLFKNGKYDLCSPYSVHFLYNPKPLLMFRRMQWDTFPGYSAAVLSSTLLQCEGEAEAILTMLMDVDTQAINNAKNSAVGDSEGDDKGSDNEENTPERSLQENTPNNPKSNLENQ